MEKVKDILGPRPPFRIHEFEGDPIDPHKIWVSYDSESDSIVIFLNGSPEPSVSVHTENDFYTMVSLKERRLIGFHVENWEKTFVPAHAEIQAVWKPIKQTQSEEQPWSTLLRMLALWTIFILRTESQTSPTLQPA